MIRGINKSFRSIDSMKKSFVCIALISFSGMACTQAQNKADTRLQETGTQADTKKEDVKAAAPVTQPKVELFKDFKAVDYSGLNQTQQASFLKIVNAESCPCACPKTWAACMQSENECPAGTILAKWLIKRLANDVPEDLLAELVGNEINAYMSTPKQPKTEGFTQKGNPEAAIKIVEFADFQCGHCAKAVPVMNDLVKKHAKDISVTFKHFPFDSHPWSKVSAEAVEAAGMQGKFWEMLGLVFKTQLSLSETTIEGHARLLGLDMKKWQSDRKSKIVLDRVAQSKLEAKQFSMESTPTFYVNGRKFELFRDQESFEMRFEMERVRTKSQCK